MHLFRNKKEANVCVLCNKVLKHRHKAKAEWGIDGFLCGDCHIKKTREFYIDKQTKELPDVCALCNKELVENADINKPRWQWNMDSGTLLCGSCYAKKGVDFEKKINFCTICQKKLGFIRYNPKKAWKIDGYLCRHCWDNQNQRML